jgi:hypothetical protein
LLTSHAKEKPGREAAEEGRGAVAREKGYTSGEEDWTAGAVEEKNGLSSCSIVGEAVGKVF